jgi:hypothetical protein
MSASMKAMSGRPHSALTGAYSNPWLCTSASPNSPATFQMMNEIFQDLITEGVVSVYLDDILQIDGGTLPDYSPSARPHA